ncbi:GNAT family N-acetyltransferase [Sphingomonas sp. CLY1604]|uniref:GNAT family N-acetyltransferase n=1 Tax=Sphingomonas sp. CLY1604 TaxID=3457786 RepID=UPI003FD8BDBB
MRGWLAARSLSRGLPMPVADSGGWRVDTGSEAERRRYVFADAGPGLTRLLATITEPRVFVKLCADAATYGALLPAGWAITDANGMMVTDAVVGAQPLPAGYRLTVDSAGDVTHAVITAPDGGQAASGYAAALDGIFVYDRIVTDEAHRRRGLGRALMATLGARRPAHARQVLTATAMGEALYATLGWRRYTAYTTATLA